MELASHLIFCGHAHIMLADVLPNILAFAPYESVFGLVCSCRALSRLPIERAQYEISMPLRFVGVDCNVTRYTNGWRVSARITDNRCVPSTVNVVYKNNAPLAAYSIADGGGPTWIISLVTRVYCIITSDAVHIPSDGNRGNAFVTVCKSRVYRGDAVDDRVAQAVAAVLRPILFAPPGITADTIRAAVKAMNIYARHIGDRDGSLFAKPTERALKMLVAGHI